VEISNNLQRVRELAVQSANATNSESDRKALQSEVDQLVGEIDRVARQTNFNGTSLLDGSFSGQLFQVGADAGQTIGINSILDANTSKLGGMVFESVTTAASTADGTSTADVDVDDAKITGTDGKEVALDAYTLKAGHSKEDAAKALAIAINGKMDQTGVYAEANTNGTVKLTAIKSSIADDGTFNAIALTGGASTIADQAAGTAPTTKTYVADLDITTVAGAQQAMSIADKALSAVNSARAEMGAIQNRFSSTIANLSSTSENLSASRSRIRDTDYAKETAELTRTQILQQAGTAMLSQANSSTQSVLSLLG
jgi:flagellin